MQLDGWKKARDAYYATYNNSLLGFLIPANPVAFTSYFFGLGSDHAEDQKKLARLAKEWKKICALHLHGEKLMQATALIDLLPILMEEKERKIQEAGGPAAWEALPECEKDRLDQIGYDRLCQRFGKKAWESLTDAERHEIQLFIWAGCCMHKEMNSVKGGARALAEYWEKSGTEGPIKLMNRDNAAAAATGPSAAQTCALEVSSGGAVRLTLLVGMMLHHKDDKKGQQDSF
jgi:hypothetical protein